MGAGLTWAGVQVCKRVMTHIRSRPISISSPAPPHCRNPTARPSAPDRKGDAGAATLKMEGRRGIYPHTLHCDSRPYRARPKAPCRHPFLLRLWPSPL